MGDYRTTWVSLDARDGPSRSEAAAGRSRAWRRSKQGQTGAAPRYNSVRALCRVPGKRRSREAPHSQGANQTIIDTRDGPLADSAHIVPLLGARKVTSVTADVVEEFMHDVIDGKVARKQKLGPRAVSNVRGGRGAASRTIGLLGAIFAYAVRKGIRPDNPVRGIIRPADRRRDRRLTAEEYGQLSIGLASLGTWPHGVAAARFLVLSGWRTGEVTGLRWREVDLVRRTARLERTKTGASLRPLSRDVTDLLAAQRTAVPDTSANALVFPASRGSGPMSGFRRIFGAQRRRAPSSRHNAPRSSTLVASEAADLGYSEPTIAALIGHKGGGVTRRYIHSADAVLLAAADGVAARIASLLAGQTRAAAA